MPLILLLETATGVCSVGLSQGDTLLGQVRSDKPFNHVAQITKLIEQCVEKQGKSLSEIDAIAVSQGPGSYTSLRVGTATAKGICYALDKPLIAVDTLQSLAWASSLEQEGKALYCPMIDARRMEVYTAVFNEMMEYVQETEAHILKENSFSHFLDKGKTLVISGNGAAKCRTVLQHPAIVYSDIVCKASNLVPFALKAFEEKTFVDLAYYAPLYFKPPNITRPKKNLL